MGKAVITLWKGLEGANVLFKKIVRQNGFVNWPKPIISIFFGGGGLDVTDFPPKVTDHQGRKKI